MLKQLIEIVAIILLITLLFNILMYSVIFYPLLFKVKPVGEIHFSLEDSFRDTWRKSKTYRYKGYSRHGYDLCLMSELPANQNPLPHRIYFEKATDNTLKYVLRSGMGEKITGKLELAVEEFLSKQLLESKKAEILKLLAEKKHYDIRSYYPDSDYEMCLMSELPIDQKPLPRKVYFDHTETPGVLKCMVLSPEGKTLVGEVKHHFGNAILLPEKFILNERFKYSVSLPTTDPGLRAKFKKRFENLGANFDIDGGRQPLSKDNLEKAKYEILRETAAQGLTPYENWITLNTSLFTPTKFIMDDGKIVIPYADNMHINYYGQTGKEFRDLRISLINKKGICLLDAIIELQRLIKSIDAAGWQRAPGYLDVVGKLDPKLMVIRLFDIPRPRGTKFMKWIKDGYVLNIGGYAEIVHYPEEKKPDRLVIVTRLEITKDLKSK